MHSKPAAMTEAEKAIEITLTCLLDEVAGLADGAITVTRTSIRHRAELPIILHTRCRNAIRKMQYTTYVKRNDGFIH